MGKIRIKKLGTEELEIEQKRKAEKRRLTKRAKKEGKAIEEVAEERGSTDVLEATLQTPEEKTTDTKDKISDMSAKKRRGISERSQRYKNLKKLIDRSKTYPIEEAIDLVKKTSKARFTETIEAHINLKRLAKDMGLKGSRKSKKDTKNEETNGEVHVSYEKKLPVGHAKIGNTKDAKKDIENHRHRKYQKTHPLLHHGPRCESAGVNFPIIIFPRPLNYERTPLSLYSRYKCFKFFY